MKKTKKIICATVALLAFCQILGTTVSMFAVGTGSTTVNVFVEGEVVSSQLVDVFVNSEPSPVITYNADNQVEFRALGSGTISIIDPVSGALYFTIAKANTDWEHFVANITLPKVGRYNLIVRFEVDGGSVIDAPIQIDYLSIPLPPTTGTNMPLGDHYTYIGGYAIHTIDILILSMVFAVIFFLIFVWMRHDDKDEKQKMAQSTRVGSAKAARVMATKSPNPRKAAVRSKK